MKTLRYLFIITAIVLIGVPQIINAKGKEQVPIPTAARLRWQNGELAALVCWDLHALGGKFYVQSEARITPVEDYNIFNPQKYDMDQWIKSLKDTGFKIAILTVSHETGFFLHQSDVTPYYMKALKWQDGKGDILRDFKTSCEKNGILPGVYIGIRWNSFYGIHDFKVNGEGAVAENRQKHYNTMIERIVEEIFTRYGDWAMVWFDGGAHGPDVLSAFEKYQPNCLFYHNLQRADVRWGGTESGTVPYPCWSTFGYPAWFNHSDAKENFAPIKNGDPGGKYYMPAMVDAPLRGYKGRHEWFCEPGDEANIFPVQQLKDMYDGSVGHNATLIVGLTTDANGLIPQQDADTVKAFGDDIKNSFNNPLVPAKGDQYTITVKMPKGKMFNQIVIEEAVEKGQRIREFMV